MKDHILTQTTVIGSKRERLSIVPVVGDDDNELGVVSVSIEGPTGADTAVVIAHGGGGTMDTPSIKVLQRHLANSGIRALRFNFLYSERGKKTPDRETVLISTWRSVADWTRQMFVPKRLFLIGRSMGGRIASYLAEDQYPCDGICLLAYPLHPPGKPEKQRKKHLAKLSVPICFVSGTRDTFAKLELLKPIAKKLKARLHLIEGGNHGFRVPQKYGKTSTEIDDEVGKIVLEFIS